MSAAGGPVPGGGGAGGSGGPGVAIQSVPQAPATQSIALRYLRKHPLPPAFKALYAIEDELGAGGCGFCMSAVRHADGREVCAKFILKSRVSSQSWVKDETYFAGGPGVNPGSDGGRYMGQPHTSAVVPLEVYLLRRIRHPGIVTYFDCFEDVRFFILVMELHGTSWERKVDLPSCSVLTDSLVTSVKSRDAHIFVDEESDEDDGDADSDSEDVESGSADEDSEEDDDERIDRMEISVAGNLGLPGPGQSAAARGKGPAEPAGDAQSARSGSGGSGASSDFGPANNAGPSAGGAQPGQAGKKATPLTPPPTPPVNTLEAGGEPGMIPGGVGGTAPGRPPGPGRFFPNLNAHGPNGGPAPSSSSSKAPVPGGASHSHAPHPHAQGHGHAPHSAQAQAAAQAVQETRPPVPPPPPPRPSPSSLPPAPVTGVRKRASCDLFEAIEKLQYFTEPQARHIFRQIAEAVFYLQVRCGIVHRDIKDENVVIDSNLTVKLIDLGNASFIPTSPEGYFDRYYGTLQYCPPEILLGARYRGPEAEMWSLGILLYTICCGELPFADAQQAIHLRYATPRYSRSPECIDLMDRLLEKDPARRATIEEVLRHRWFAIPL